MNKDLDFWVAGNKYTVNCKVEEIDGKDYVSATEMERVNDIIAQVIVDEILKRDVLTPEERKFLKDIGS